ncbi:MAG TPA: phosphoribosylglycinamide formyltransferase [Bacteroidia bacterium]|nr:phosphoribosylglycinamide formyltransferase [Bacteroidia bacterium]
MNKIAIFASGSGTNAENIIHYFNNNHPLGCVKMVLTNNAQAGVINRCKKLSVPIFVLKNNDFENSELIVNLLYKNEIDWIVLAGFLKKISPFLIDAYPNKIVNIHPSLLPLYGGKGMYGAHVHEAVIAAKEKQSGISIHFVNAKYDDGAIIYQAKCEIESSDNAISLASKIHQLEMEHFPKVLEQLLEPKQNSK